MSKYNSDRDRKASRLRTRKWSEAHPGRMAERTREWRRNNPERYKEQTKKYRAEHYTQKRRLDLKTKYGISIEECAALSAKQGDVCAICKKIPTDKFGLCVDHDHKLGKVRGLLCSRCNHGIGHFKDDVTLLKRAIKYLT